MKAGAMINMTYNPFDEPSRVSRLKENLTSGSDGEGLETSRASTTISRQPFTRQLAFRHLKMAIKIEHIRKSTLHRIRQLLWGAIILFSLSAMIRNNLKYPTLFPKKEKVKIYCFEFIIQLSEFFFLAATGIVYRYKEKIRRRLRAMRNCWFLYEPWRA